jgi:hypothetical protein
LLTKSTGLTGPAGLARPCRSALATRRLPSSVPELAQDLAELVVDVFKDRRPLGEVHLLDRGESRDGRVDTRVTGGGESRTRPFWIHCFYFLRLGGTHVVLLVRYPPA